MPGRLRDPGPRATGTQLARALRGAGASAAEATAHEASAGQDVPGSGDTRPYEEWTTSDLRRRAADAGIAGRSRMRKSELIEALRDS